MRIPRGSVIALLILLWTGGFAAAADIAPTRPSTGPMSQDDAAQASSLATAKEILARLDRTMKGGRILPTISLDANGHPDPQEFQASLRIIADPTHFNIREREIAFGWIHELITTGNIAGLETAMLNALVQTVDQPDWNVSSLILCELSPKLPNTAASAYLQLVRHKSRAVHRSSLYAILNTKVPSSPVAAPSATPVVTPIAPYIAVELLTSADQNDKPIAAEMADSGHLDPAACVPLLTRLLSSPDPQIRKGSIDGIRSCYSWRFNGPYVNPVDYHALATKIQPLLMDADPGVARAAVTYMDTFRNHKPILIWQAGSPGPVRNPNYIQPPTPIARQVPSEPSKIGLLLVISGIAIVIGYVILEIFIWRRIHRRSH